MKNIDRFFGFVMVGLVLALAYIVLTSFNWSWAWWGSALMTIGFGIWTKKGFQKIEVGWRGLLLYFGQRRNHEVEEGWHWVPFPFALKLADCRQVVIKLDTLEKIITRDNVQVDIEGSIFRQIFNLYKYFGVEESGIRQGLDDIWDATIREKVADTDLAYVLKMHADLAGEAKNAMATQASENWGINILRVVIASIKPDIKVAEDLALKERENLQRNGQRVQARHQVDLVKFFSGTEKLGDEGPTGPGLSPDLAYEASLIHMDKAEKKKLASNTFGLDVATVKALVEAVTGRK